jgi:hypothetical protein
MARKSWKTSLAALSSALGLALSQAPPDALPHWLRVAGLILSVIGLALAGIFARDNDVSSEDVGIKERVTATIGAGSTVQLAEPVEVVEPEPQTTPEPAAPGKDPS